MDISKSSIITIAKNCRVCGDKALGFHFSALSCDSCKAFFRRTAFKNDLYCKNGNNCEINQITRNNCMKCRFKKCVAIGMKKELVLSLPKITNIPKQINPTVLPIDRMRLLSNGRTLTLKMGELSRLGALFGAFQVFPNASSCQIVGQVDNVSQIVNLSVANVKHMIQFCKNMSEFNCLTKDEQVIALKSLVPEINLIRAAFNFDTEANGWAALENSECDKRAVFIKMNIFKSLNDQEKYNFFARFIIDLHKEMENDHAIRDLILAQMVFRHWPKMEANLEFVRYHNAVFHYLLRCYLEHKYLDTSRAGQKYSKLMGLLAKLDIIGNAVREYFAKAYITTPVTPEIKEIYNLHQT